MCSTLGISSEVGEEKSINASSEKDRRISTKNKGSKIQKTRTLMNLASVLKSYDGGNSLDDVDDLDEIQEYFKAKLSIGDRDNILHWWKDRSLIFPK